MLAVIHPPESFENATAFTQYLQVTDIWNVFVLIYGRGSSTVK